MVELDCVVTQPRQSQIPSRMPFKATLLVALALFTHSQLFGQPTSEEIAAALDDTTGWTWTIEATGDYTLEVIEDATAVNGTALKLTVPYNSTFILKRDFGEASVVFFDYKIEVATTPRFYGYREGHSGVKFPENDQDVNEWTPAQFQLFYNKAGWSVESVNDEQPDQVVYIDNFRREPGYQVTYEGLGTTVTIDPEKSTFRGEEFYRLTAEPIDENHEFLFWTENGSRIHNQNPFHNLYPADPWRDVLQSYTVSHHVGVGGKRYEYGALDVLVPQNYDITESLDENQAAVFTVDASNSD